MQTKKDAAIQLAAQVFTENGCSHGPLLRAEPYSSESQMIWEVEFAHKGVESRSEIADPPSVVLIVNLDQRTVRLADPM